MKALCTTPTRTLILQDIPSPDSPPPGYINIRISSAAINPGDKTFLKLPPSALTALTSGARVHNTWGASASGTVLSIGPDVPSSYLNRKVAIYRGLKPSSDILGLWCEIAQVPYQCCLLLPENLDMRDYSGSLVNAVTAFAFLEEVAAEGHKGVIVTAGSSATGRALVVLAKKKGIEILVVVRSEKAKEEVIKNGVEGGHVLNSTDATFLFDLEQKAKEFGTTAVFDGVGGTLISHMLGALPPKSTIYFYGFLSGAEKVEFPSAVFMMKDLRMKRFSNFDTVTVKERLGDMLRDLEGVIDNPLFRTSLGTEFELEEIEKAMEYEGGRKKAVLLFEK